MEAKWEKAEDSETSSKIHTCLQMSSAEDSEKVGEIKTKIG